MALAVILVLYLSIGVLAAIGSIALARRLFSARAERNAFALFLIAIAAFYLAFAAYFGDGRAWPFETAGVVAFAVLGLLALRLRVVLVLGYGLHGLWDLLHELHAHAGVNLAGQHVTAIPLAYGAFCAAYDWCIATYYARGGHPR